MADDFNDDEDFKLSTDHQGSLAGLQSRPRLHEAKGSGDLYMQDRVAMQQHQVSTSPKTFGEGLRDGGSRDQQPSLDFSANNSMLQ